MRILTDVQIELAHDMEIIAEALAGGFKLPPRKTILDVPFAQKMRAEFEAENKKRNEDIAAKNAADAKAATDAAQKHFADEEQKRLASLPGRANPVPPFPVLNPAPAYHAPMSGSQVNTAPVSTALTPAFHAPPAPAFAWKDREVNVPVTPASTAAMTHSDP